ncbi:MAG: response regulator [Pseudomonadota bacterium]
MADALETPKTDLETILVVEDEILVRTAIAKYLRDCGYRVVETASADEALHVIQNQNIQIDIVFSDVQMPGTMDGFGLAQWIRQHRPDLEVILTGTAEKAAEAAGDLCEEGPNLAKPYQPQQVIDWIKRLKASKKP